MNKLFYALFLLLITSILSSSCNKDDDDKKPKEQENSDTLLTNQFIYQIMKGEAWYLWHDKVPDIKPDKNISPDEYLYSLMYKELDKWSFLIDNDSYVKYFEQGVYYGLGFSYKFHTDSTLRVKFVFNDSPMSRAGVKRGDKVLTINGHTVEDISKNNQWETIFGDNASGISVNMQIENQLGEVKDIVVQKEEVNKNTVLTAETYMLDSGEKVGYIVFQSFIGVSIPELDKAFEKFSEQNIRKLIVDLRYNTGGQLNVAKHFGNLIAGVIATDKVFAEIKHNELHDDSNKKEIYKFVPVPNNLYTKQVVFLTSKMSASASEVLINGIKPHIESVLIGDDTYGKPVGMQGFQYKDQILFPVTFRTINSEGESDYYDGIKADAYVPDGIDKPFGDPDESGFKEAMFYLNNGAFSSVTKKSKEYKMKVPQMTGFRNYIGAY